MRAVILFLLVLATASSAKADACDDFNLLRFQPGRLEECIKHLKFTYDLQINTFELENRSLQSEICILAMELRDVRPSAFEALKDECIPPKLKKNTTVRGPKTKQ